MYSSCDAFVLAIADDRRAQAPGSVEDELRRPSVDAVRVPDAPIEDGSRIGRVQTFEVRCNAHAVDALERENVDENDAARSALERGLPAKPGSGVIQRRQRRRRRGSNGADCGRADEQPGE
jgi:hypothetical protein